MAATYTLISSVTVGSNTSTITFSSIPATYTDLKLVTSLRANNANGSQGWYDAKVEFNGNTSSYTLRALYGNGSSALSFSDTVIYDDLASSATTANTFSNSEIYIPNYLSANYKSVSVDSVTENNATSSKTGLYAGLWSNTAAITSITLTGLNSSLFVQYSTAYLYGISNA
jgi:hypothetical protein